MKEHYMEWDMGNQQYLSGMIKLLKHRVAAGASAGDGQQDFTADEENLNKLAAAMPMPPAIEKVAAVFNLSNFEKNILLMCAGLELDAGLSEMLMSSQPEQPLIQPTFGLALAAFPNGHWSAVAPGSPLRYWRLIEVNKTQLITRSPIKIDEHMLHYIAGIAELNEKLNDIAAVVKADDELVPSQQKTADSILQTISNSNGELPVIQLYGIDRFDKLNIAAYISASVKATLYSIAAYSLPVNSREIAELSRLWSREAALNNYILFLDCSGLDINEKPRLQSLVNFIENIQGLVILNADQWTPELKRNKIGFDVTKPKSAEQMQLWHTVMGNKREVLNGGLDNIVSQFNLSSGTIRKAGIEAMSQLSQNDNGNGNVADELQKNLWSICCRYTRPQVDELAQRIEPVATWNDIVLPELQKNILHEMAAQVKHRKKVYDEWGFASKGSRGLGISALFAGESGTGKTMAAEVMANELGLDLYKIDLSKVVNKYIGETEKNLKKIFDAAEEGGAILLFDEADALFGKRSDVKDSHDRYSNIEVSYLLQRMEAYRGLAILTTNMKSALDKAFTRRIRFIIDFPFPDAMQRADIWSRVFPEKTPMAELDLEKLARLSITGGSIKNIAMNAAFIAAHENKAVEMLHILKAAKTEYDKTEKPYTLELKSR